ncbi:MULTISPECIES: helix-turn-helix domain-containing protein [unclassified Enterococcus]|uniref:helix-turn-helix domain-containing protein n=1 Tax=unclassified Enterococcus TaxID=2608891 RepID=UPI001CE0CE3C|nr:MULTISPECIES: helix-turn-helix domain-containing protein [unclassified Enterococcus]MCA5013929.1 helix-turn-helix domain-containing protein [Enterococcus sp. S23]MCA5017297.1 helix-turn-helix domain-containing protein [Enterococcus sp. S22(2020)]
MIANENYRVRYHQLTDERQELAKETTILLVLKGELLITIEEKSETIQAGELFVINASDYFVLSRQTHESCFYIELTINSLFFASQFPAFFYTYFDCRPKQKEYGKLHAVLSLRRQIAELCLVKFSEESAKQLKASLYLTQIILSLVHNFQREEESTALHSENQTLRDILEYIENNYQRGVSLAETAEHFFMSEPTLSKFFKKETGDYFSHYVRSLAVKHSLTELLYTKKSIEQIALDVGFHSSKTYREQFKKLFQVSPTDYRFTHLAKKEVSPTLHLKASTTDLTIKEILPPLYSYLQTTLEEAQSSELSLKTKQLQITCEKTVTDYQKKEVIIKVGTLENLALKKVQEELIELNEEIGIDYISVHSLYAQLPLTVQIHQEAGMNSFPAFEKLDCILAFLNEHRFRLFFQLSLPKFRAMGAYERENYRKFFRHVQSTFGKQMLTHWKINCRFEEQQTDNYHSEFLELKKIIDSQFPEIEIGAELSLDDPFFEYDELSSFRFFFKEIAPFCKFVSFSAEPNYVFRNLDSTFPDLKNYHQYVLNKTFYIKHLMKEFDVKLPLYLTEWNTLTGMTRISNGTFFRGAIILKDLLMLTPLLQGYGFWLNIDLYEVNTQNRPLKNDGLELFHYHSGKRPVYFCLWLARRLGGTVVAAGEEYIMTHSNGKYQLLLFNTNYFDPHLSTEEAFLKSHSVNIELDLSKIKPAQYQVKQIEFNRYNGALFYTYEEFKNAASLDLEAQEYIMNKSRPKMRVFDVHIQETFLYFVTLDTNGIVLLEMTPIYY